MLEHRRADVVQHVLSHTRHDPHAVEVGHELHDRYDQIRHYDISQRVDIFRADPFVNGKFDEVRSRHSRGSDDDHQDQRKKHARRIRLHESQQSARNLGVVPLIQLLFGLGDELRRDDFGRHIYFRPERSEER